MPAASARRRVPHACGPSPPLVVWRLLDGKPGHEKQSLGLIQGLEAIMPVATYELDMRFKALYWRQLRRHIAGAAGDLPAPDLIVGVGHATHVPMLLARAVCGGRTVVLMKPSVPHLLFDLIFVPQHDRFPRKRNLVGTRGVICPTADRAKADDAGLILLGGPNRTFEWRSGEVIDRVRAIARASPSTRWTVCDSRRTPEGLAAHLPREPNLSWQSWRTAPGDFLTDALAGARYVWVTADSVSMLYEALSAGARVGVISLPPRPGGRGNKHLRGIGQLRERGHVLASDDGLRLQEARAVEFPPENRRCAAIVAERLLDRRPPAS